MELDQQLERLASLHKAGSLTDEEFAAAKRLLLEGGTPPGRVGPADGAAERGWYVDPIRSGEWERFWSGTSWSGRTRRAGHRVESASLAPLTELKGKLPSSETRRPDRPIGPPPGSKGTNGLAIASLVLGVLGWCGIGSLLAIVFGRQARDQIRASEGAETGEGLAEAGIVLGQIGLIAVGLAIIVALLRAVAG